MLVHQRISIGEFTASHFCCWHPQPSHLVLFSSCDFFEIPEKASCLRVPWLTWLTNDPWFIMNVGNKKNQKCLRPETSADQSLKSRCPFQVTRNLDAHPASKPLSNIGSTLFSYFLLGFNLNIFWKVQLASGTSSGSAGGGATFCRSNLASWALLMVWGSLQPAALQLPSRASACRNCWAMINTDQKSRVSKWPIDSIEFNTLW